MTWQEMPKMVLQPRSPTFFPRAKQAPHNTQHPTRGDTDTDTQRYFYRPQPAPTFTHVRFTTVEWWKRGDCAGTGASRHPGQPRAGLATSRPNQPDAISNPGHIHESHWPHTREPLATIKRATSLLVFANLNTKSSSTAAHPSATEQVHGPPPTTTIVHQCRLRPLHRIQHSLTYDCLIMYMAAHHWEMQHPHLQNRPQNHPACSLVRPDLSPLVHSQARRGGRGLVLANNCMEKMKGFRGPIHQTTHMHAHLRLRGEDHLS
ncbi:hypothetical protein EV126DRAFT_235231 [Verticillium dahliae]|nr:hypothetical protein EV126DRAFT_235231 [Verticillium dahliae]